MTVWKFHIPQVTPFVAWLPQGARIVAVQVQDAAPYFWAEVDPNAEGENRVFHIVGTGRNLPSVAERRCYLGTWQAPPYVFHLYEEVSP